MTLVDDARACWRWWSVRMAALAGVVAGALVAQPQILTGLVAYVPEPWRPAASALAGLVVFAAPTMARLIQQGSKANGQSA
ncbi:hypothetical protein FHW96_000302 [Novosphingobium sp. SG751A]|uniref:DUF7940 domain-containing protein n=1 Tax=Novosphingobium sp. SG751A TaxID=2587000 RepID=UPI00155380EF|nr:hypothetical protein [Novosphingobium sp. SG751A]NOW44175.1 hypothetical protein [Novosphingobium sp. SG751A]